VPDMPTLGPPRRSPLVPLALAATTIGLLAGGGYWLATRSTTPAPEPATAASLAPAPIDAGALAASPAPGTPTPPAPPTGPYRAFTTTIQGPLESAITGAAGRDGVALTQVVTRTLVWWLRVPQDLARGDRLAVVYEPREGQEPLVHAVRLVSGRLGKTFEAWRFKPAGAAFARVYQADGTELEERLVDGPLDAYEQVTSLLRDGRRHRGVDFKTPVGTPVKATFDGVVARRNWNFRGNGNSLDIAESGGKGLNALFLHLSELEKGMQPGATVKKGQIIGRSGNTGHSFAPHLHYQLMRGETVVDPFQIHQTTRATLPASARPDFDAERARLDALLPAGG
jgi:murein DD-endopeptidase